MAYVTVPRDLTHVKSKVVFRLTRRQPICFSGALVIDVPSCFLTRDYLTNSAVALFMVFAILPGFLLVMYEHHGQPLEMVTMQTIQCCFIQPEKYPYQADNTYTASVQQYQVEQEVKVIVQKGDPKGDRRNKADSRLAKRN